MFFLLLIAMQPDIGGAGIILVIGVVMIFASGVSVYLGVGSGLLGIGVIFGVLEMVQKLGENTPFLDKYQYQRFVAFGILLPFLKQ